MQKHDRQIQQAIGKEIDIYLLDVFRQNALNAALFRKCSALDWRREEMEFAQLLAQAPDCATNGFIRSRFDFVMRSIINANLTRRVQQHPLWKETAEQFTEVQLAGADMGHRGVMFNVASGVLEGSTDLRTKVVYKDDKIEPIFRGRGISRTWPARFQLGANLTLKSISFVAV